MTESRWIPVSERLPESNRLVLAAYRNHCDNSRVVRAEYAAPKTLPVNDESVDSFGEYDDETGEYWCPEGWYEHSDNGEMSYHITDEVTHWMPLPSPPGSQPRSWTLDSGLPCHAAQPEGSRQDG